MLALNGNACITTATSLAKLCVGFDSVHNPATRSLSSAWPSNGNWQVIFSLFFVSTSAFCQQRRSGGATDVLRLPCSHMATGSELFRAAAAQRHACSLAVEARSGGHIPQREGTLTLWVITQGMDGDGTHGNPCDQTDSIPTTWVTYQKLKRGTDIGSSASSAQRMASSAPT